MMRAREWQSHDQKRIRNKIRARDCNGSSGRNRGITTKEKRLDIMEKFKQWLKDRWEEPSTKKGLALIAAGGTLALGRPELITASVTETGVQWGGLVGATVPLVIGVWETVRNEWKRL